MINPANIDLNSLPWLPLEAKSAFPKQAAIYFAIDSQGCIQYVGRAVNVHARWGNHHKYRQLETIGNVRIAYLLVDTPDLLPDIESALITYFKPLLNKEFFKCKPRQKKPTVNRSLRLLDEVAEALENYSDEQMLSNNAAVNKLLRDKLIELGYIKEKQTE